MSLQILSVKIFFWAETCLMSIKKDCETCLLLQQEGFKPRQVASEHLSIPANFSFQKCKGTIAQVL